MWGVGILLWSSNKLARLTPLVVTPSYASQVETFSSINRRLHTKVVHERRGPHIASAFMDVRNYCTALLRFGRLLHCTIALRETIAVLMVCKVVPPATPAHPVKVLYHPT